jgi:general secretion pathway protein A
MYTNYFSLKQAPFSIAPDPRYLFMSARHREALAHLLYGVGSGGGFVLLTGEIGAGKTTVCRCFIEQVPGNCRLAYIFNPKLSVEELLQTICDEFHVGPPAGAGVKGYVDAINGYLLASHAQGDNNVLVIDEAQNLSPAVLEQLRLLTNLETSERKLLQIILIGQPELRTMLARPELEQLAQRVIARYHLGPLTVAETAAYVAHRLAVAGASASTPIPAALAPLIHGLTHGVPRRINLLCDRALLGAYAENSPGVTRTILRRAAREVFVGENEKPAWPRWPVLAGGVLAGALLGVGVAWSTMPRAPAPGPVAHAARPAPALVANVAASGPPARPVEAAPAHAAAITGSAEDEAVRELAGLWGPPLGPGEPCKAALMASLRCYQSKGGLYELRLLDRPAVVTLRDGTRQAYAVIKAIGTRSVTLVANGARQEVDLAAFVTRFDGSFTTLWKMPRGFREQVDAGAHGPDVDWIAQQLAQLDKSAPPQVGQPLGARTRELLRAFQQKQDLKADGVAGPRTYMRLNQLSGVDEPRLFAAGTGK